MLKNIFKFIDQILKITMRAEYESWAWFAVLYFCAA